MKSSEKIKTKFSEICIDAEGILHVQIEDGAQLDLKEIRSCFDVYKQLGCQENKVLQLIEAKNFFRIDKQAQEYASKNAKNFFIASALVNNSMAIRLTFNLFNAFYKQPVPFKLFETEEKALKWLRTFK